MTDFTKIPRGKPRVGAEALAETIFEDPKRAPSVYSIDRAEFGIQIIAGKLVGYTGWLDHVLATRAAEGQRQRRPRRVA